MKVRVCPNCRKHNEEKAWSCTNCGETLSVNTLIDVEFQLTDANNTIQDSSHIVTKSISEEIDWKCKYCGWVNSGKATCAKCGKSRDAFDSPRQNTEIPNAPIYNELTSNLQRGNDQQRRVASYKLGKLKDPFVVAYLISAYNDRDPSVRQNIFEGLISINTKETKEFLNLPENLKQVVVQQLQQSPPTVEILQKILFEFIPEFSNKTPTQDAIDHYQRARTLEKQNKGEMKITLIKDILSELALAIKKADAPFPEAQAMGARFFFKIEDWRNAEYNANIALQQDHNQFYAQQVKIDLAWNSIVEKVQKGTNSVNSSSGLILTLLISSVGMSRVNSALTDMKNEVVKLVDIFRRICETGVESNEYLRMSVVLIEWGDIFQDIPSFPSGRPNLYAEVVNIPMEKINKMEGMDQQVSEIRRKAEGRSLIFKPN